MSTIDRQAIRCRPKPVLHQVTVVTFPYRLDRRSLSNWSF